MREKKINMYDIDEIMNILDCHKNVWENCAKILIKKTDEELKPYLCKLLEWLQDLTWSGAVLILERLKIFREIEWFCTAFEKCVKVEVATDDEMWMVWLAELLYNQKLKETLPEDMVNMLESKKEYYLNYDE